MLFSVGADGAPAPDVAGVVAVVGVVVVVVSGGFSPLPQAAVIAPIAVVAETPEMAATRRPKRREFTVQSYLCHDLARSPVPAKARTGDRVALVVAVSARCCCRRPG